MAVLVLTLDGPMQSWGITEKLKSHKTDFIPSKSGIVGMIASAEGRRRDEDISDLAGLRFGVRIDSPGTIIEDFQISVVGGSFGETKDYYRNGHLTSTIKEKRTKIGTRYYLADAVFTCGIEGDRERLEEIKDALLYPANALYLGRRNCPVTANLVQGIVEGTLEDVLKDGSGHRGFLDIGGDDASCEKFRITKDLPISFNPEHRIYALRKYKEVRF